MTFKEKWSWLLYLLMKVIRNIRHLHHYDLTRNIQLPDKKFVVVTLHPRREENFSKKNLLYVPRHSRSCILLLVDCDNAAISALWRFNSLHIYLLIIPFLLWDFVPVSHTHSILYKTILVNSCYYQNQLGRNLCVSNIFTFQLVFQTFPKCMFPQWTIAKMQPH